MNREIPLSPILAALVGAWIGGVLGGLSGALVGAFIAYMILQSRLSASPTGVKEERLARLERRIAALEDELAHLRHAAGTLPAETADRAISTEPTTLALELPESPAALLEQEIELQPATTPPSAVDAIATRLRTWLFGGNTLVRVGILVLFFGLAFLARYAAEAGLLPVELRLSAVAAGGIALLVTGWRLRGRRAAYALTLQGGGVAVLYLTVFAALRLYQLLPASLAFGLLLAIVTLATLLAILQDSIALAVVGSAGGFVAPILASTGAGSHVQLFGYYTLLNAGVLVMAWIKAWRLLNLVGFAFTFLIGLAWGARFYRPEFFSTTEPFLLAFFLMYLAAAVFYAHRQAPELGHYVDGTLVFGLPVVGFGLQAALVKDMPFALAWSALAVGGLYIALAAYLRRRAPPNLGLLVEAFLGLGVAFLTLAIPLALEGRWTAAAWAMEGAALVWVGCRQERALATLAGLLLQIAAGFAFVADHGLSETGRTLVLLNSQCLGAALLALAGLFSSRLAHAYAPSARAWPWLGAAGWGMLAWGVAWWVLGGFTEMGAQLPTDDLPIGVLLFGVASAALAAWATRRLAWDGLALAGLLGFPAMLGALLLTALEGSDPSTQGGFVAWPLAVALHFWALARIESAQAPQRLFAPAHGLGVWIIALALGWGLEARFEGLAGQGWSQAMPAVAGCLALGLVTRQANRTGWPVGPWRGPYLRIGGGGIAVFLAVWSVAVNAFGDGGSAPIPTLPGLNPIDLTLVASALAGVAWVRALRSLDPLPAWQAAIAPIAGAAAFLAASAAVLRAVHHVAGVPYDLPRLIDSDTAQASLSLFWGLSGLVLMLVASRRGLRPVWLAGAGLMALVVAKLFLVDMAASGTVARIISFIGAGLLLLVVGWFSPLPPKESRP